MSDYMASKMDAQIESALSENEQLRTENESLRKQLAVFVSALDEEKIVSHIGVFNIGDDPRKAIKDLMLWSQGVGEYFATEKAKEQLAARVPDGTVLVDRGALNMTINVLRRDEANGMQIRGELADMLAAIPQPVAQGDPVAVRIRKYPGGWRYFTGLGVALASGEEMQQLYTQPQLSESYSTPERVALTADLPSVVDAVEFRRDQYGLNCAQWAYVLGITPSHYSEFLNGIRELPKNAMAQAYAYGVPASALFQQHPSKGSWDIDRRMEEMRKAAHGIKGAKQ